MMIGLIQFLMLTISFAQTNPEAKPPAFDQSANDELKLASGGDTESALRLVLKDCGVRQVSLRQVIQSKKGATVVLQCKGSVDHFFKREGFYLEGENLEALYAEARLKCFNWREDKCEKHLRPFEMIVLGETQMDGLAQLFAMCVIR